MLTSERKPPFKTKEIRFSFHSLPITQNYSTPLIPYLKGGRKAGWEGSTSWRKDLGDYFLKNQNVIRGFWIIIGKSSHDSITLSSISVWVRVLQRHQANRMDIIYINADTSKRRLSIKLTQVVMEAKMGAACCLGAGQPEKPLCNSSPVWHLRTGGIGWRECKSQAEFKGPTLGARVSKSGTDARGSLSKSTQAPPRSDDERFQCLSQRHLHKHRRKSRVTSSEHSSAQPRGHAKLTVTTSIL